MEIEVTMKLLGGKSRDILKGGAGNDRLFGGRK